MWNGEDFGREALFELKLKGVERLTCLERMGAGEDIPSKSKCRGESSMCLS